MSSIPADFDRNQLADRNWKGEGININKDIARKPTEKNRRCTDILCCIIFLAFLVGMLTAAIYGYVNGDPWKLIAPIDGASNICGFDAGYEDYTKLYIADITSAAQDPHNVFQWGVCVKSCPESATDEVECKPTAPTGKVSVCNKPNNQYGTKDIINYCYPIYDTLPQTAKDHWSEMKDEVNSTGFGGMFSDMLNAKWVFLIAMGLAVVLTLVYIKFMDWCAFCLSWFSIVLVFASLVGSGIGAYVMRQNKIADDPAYEDTSDSTWLNFTAWLCWILAGIYLIVIICTFQSLRVAIAVIETAADFFADTKRIIFVPVLYFFIGICLFVMWIAAMICVASIGNIIVEDVETQSKDIEWNETTEWAVWYMIFGIIWIMAFLVAANDFVVIVSAITWYYSDKTEEDDDGIPGDSDVRFGFWWSVRYHFGSLAFGSFILTLIWIIRVIFEYIGEKMIDASGNNGCTRCLIGCIRCCLDCFDRFMRYLNRNAFIYMALSGESFCSSALNAFILILKNMAKFSFVEGIADMFMFLAKFFIAIGTTALCQLIMMAWEGMEPSFAPLAVVFLISYLIASMFMSIFDVSANTILQCYLMDKEIAAQQGIADPDHIPPTMEKFFNHPVVQDKMKKQGHAPQRPQDDEKQNLIA